MRGGKPHRSSRSISAFTGQHCHGSDTVPDDPGGAAPRRPAADHQAPPRRWSRWTPPSHPRTARLARLPHASSPIANGEPEGIRLPQFKSVHAPARPLRVGQQDRNHGTSFTARRSVARRPSPVARRPSPDFLATSASVKPYLGPSPFFPVVPRTRACTRAPRFIGADLPCIQPFLHRRQARLPVPCCLCPNHPAQARGLATVRSLS